MEVKAIGIILGCLLMVSCGFLFMTPYPAFLSLAEEIKDISALIDPDPGNCQDCLSMHVLNGQVFLILRNRQLIIFDRDLKVLGGDTRDFNGRFGTFDPPDYDVGGERYDALFVWNVAGYSQNSVYTNSGGTTVQIYTNGDMLEFAGEVGPTGIPAALGDRYLADCFLIQSEVFLIFSTNNDDADVLVFNEPDISGIALTGLYPFPTELVRSFKIPNAYDNGYHATDQGLIVNRNGKFSFYTPAGKRESTVWGGRLENAVVAFDPIGDVFYAFDENTGFLYRCRTWWRP